MKDSGRRGVMKLLVVALHCATCAHVAPMGRAAARAWRHPGWTYARAVQEARMSLAEAEPDEPDEEQQQYFNDDNLGVDEAAPTELDMDMSTLHQRISSMQELMVLQRRIEGLEQAWVLVFNEDTDDEAVYSMEVAQEGGAHVVLAFEDKAEAESYALSLREDLLDEVASVQALDVEALVVTSREAAFKVGIVFQGDLQPPAPSQQILITSVIPAQPLGVTMTIVPENLFSHKTSADFLDAAEDPIWVLVHDEGTGDAQYFSMSLNGTEAVVCFKDEEEAARCSLALRGKASAGTVEGPAARSMLLETLLDTLDGDDMEVCLVDEVVETIIDDAEQHDMLPRMVASDDSDEVLGSIDVGGSDAQQLSSLAPSEVRSMLDRLFESDDDDRLAA